MESAIRSAFDGESIGAFVSWLKTIRQRRISDFYTKGPGAKAPIKPIGVRDEEHPDAVEPEVADESGYVHVQDAVERVMARMSQRDCRVVELLVFQRRDAQDAVDEIAGMSVPNAHQIVSRFRRALRGELDT